jgi:acyl-CoA dehydrogenase
MEDAKSPYFTAAHRAFRQKVRGFIEKNVLPFAEGWETEGRMPRRLWEEMGREGFLGLNHDAEFGGGSPDFFYSVVYLEELGRAGYAGFRGAFSVHSYMALEYLKAAGSDFLKRKYLAPAIEGRMIAALALTERESGSDMASIATEALAHGAEYRINGSKIFVTNGLLSDFIVTAVRTPGTGPGKGGKSSISLFVVDSDSPGIEMREMRKMGWHCSDTAEIHFQDVRVPRENRIGNLNAGFFTIMKSLQVERLAAALVSLGGVDACLELTRKHLAARALFGKTLDGFQAIRHRMADLYSQAEAARQLLYHTAWLYERKETPFLECSMSKLRITELANQVADECLQFHGGHGYLADNPMSRIYRDTRLATIVGGTSEVMRELIAEMTLGQPRLNPASP